MHHAQNTGPPCRAARRIPQPQGKYAGRATPCSRVTNRPGTSRANVGSYQMKVMRYAAALVLPVVTTGATTPAPLLTQAKKIIAAEMVDPSSLQYRKLRVVRGNVLGKTLSVACGEYNARNRMGGFTGFATFAYEPSLSGVVSYKDDGSIDLFGNVSADQSDRATEMKAHILAICLGIPQ